MNIFGKAKISTALDSRHLHRFNSRHVTTADFFQLTPIYHRELIPKHKISINVRSFARLKDMPVPTFGEAKLNLRAFFVPMRTIFRGWDDFITDALHVNSGTQYAVHDNEVPCIRNDQFLDLFQKSSVTYLTDASDTTPDIIINLGSSAQAKKRFRPFGRQVYKILQSLGYTVAMNTSDTSKFSALPLLSFLRAYLDWYYPSQYYGDTTSALLTSLCLRDSAQDASMNADRLEAIFKVICYVAYGDDYFTSAFDSPNGPTDYSNVGASPIYIKDINSVGQNFNNGKMYVFNETDSTVDNYYPNTPAAFTDTFGDGSISFSQFVIDSLKSLSDFMKRHQLVGARAFERYAARFNVELPASKLNRSVYLGSHSLGMMVQDVMSTAETDGANLGSYAGKGLIIGDDGHFEYETDEFGYFMICASIIPDIAYHQGVDRKVRHLTKLDFFAPEFDSLGTQAVAAEELYVPQTMTSGVQSNFQSLNEKVFGFMPKYAEYKIPRNLLTGDFHLNSLMTGDTAPAWHLFRSFDHNSFNNSNDIVHSKSFVLPFSIVPTDATVAENGDGGQYDRIFNNVNLDEDHFVCLFYFKEDHLLPAKPLWDTYEFKENDEHRTRVVDVNGVKMN